ncbi:nucleotide exchange factor GrpE [Campylobacter sp. JMF_02 ED1]|uniref:nucleotide exchange factor GrpE n=1 Tax=Campylobacter sp. JMF_02 ED1 TaxID=2983826 RepID=UPI0022E9C25E|nr:nucleotide exchange factor GrpE [Campylobacter sp. JMF_02 ED1]MDA3051158.1 nucleotide exchange factor GrpE [Campylobacter sp. JMF_02 ED1]
MSQEFDEKTQNSAGEFEEKEHKNCGAGCGCQSPLADDSDEFSEEIQSECECESAQDDEITKLQNELSEITDKFYRASADFDNIKKRLEREKTTAVEYAAEKFAKDLLPIIDALEEAAKIDIEGNELADKIEEGVKQCINLFLSTFEKYGITPISTESGYESESGKFYPIQLVEKDGAKTNDIVQVLQKGYLYKERILRPVMVILAK